MRNIVNFGTKKEELQKDIDNNLKKILELSVLFFYSVLTNVSYESLFNQKLKLFLKL